MPKHQQRARKTPYSRPAPAPQKQGIFSRIKQFFWGQEQPTELGPPRVIPEEEEAYTTTGEDDTTGDYSRITHHSVDFSGSQSSSIPLNSAAYGATPSNVATSNRALSPNVSQANSDVSLNNAVPDGPNEALRRFFDEKGSEDLSNMEVVGVLSLIGQAVSRNESLVDFSNLSEATNTISNNTTTQVDPTETSILRGLHAPPSPRPYLRGTPPSTQTRARSQLANTTRSPWTSPRPSRISARHSIGFGFGNPTPRPSRATNAPRTSAAASASTVTPSGPSAPYSQVLRSERQKQSQTPQEDSEVTPAASAILKALDEAPSKRVLSRDAKPSTSTPSKPANVFDNAKTEVPRPNAATSTPGAFTNTSDTSLFGKPKEPSSTNTFNISPVPEKASTNSTTNSATNLATSSTPAFSFGNPKPVSQPQPTTTFSLSANKDTTRDEKTNEKPKDNTSIGEPNGQSTSQPTNGFEFNIPTSSTSRQMTPAEEEIVAKSQAEFTF